MNQRNNFITKKAFGASVLLVMVLLIQSVFAQQYAAPYTHATRYNIDGQVTGTIKPDPDGSGPLGHLATRNTYNNKGQLVMVETGELSYWPGDADPVTWVWSIPSDVTKVVYTYDSIGRKATEKVLDRYDVPLKLTQFSYTHYDQVGCKAVRMNPSIYYSLPASACTLGAQGIYGTDRITRYEYNQQEQLEKEYRAVGTPLEQLYRRNHYDTHGRLAGLRDAKGNYTELRYNTNFRLERRVYPSKTQSGALNESDYNQYTYDLNGNITVERKRNGVTITNTYDNLNRVMFRDRTGTANDVDYTYDLRGLKLTSKFRATGQGITSVFDGFGNTKTSTNTMGSVSRTLSYQYDNNGNRTRVTHPDNLFFTYIFDGINRVSSVAESTATTLLTVGYARDGARQNLTRPGGAVTTYDFDDIGRLKTFAQDIAGTTNDLTNTFGYNPGSQIIQMDLSNHLYHYGGNNNRTGTYVSNGLNQYTSVGGLSLNYDANGNLTYDGSITYNYDEENRLISTSGGASSSFQYDPLGRLFSVTLGGVTTQFLYDGDSLVAEYVSGAMTRRYVHGDRVDEPWVQYNGTGIGSTNRRYLHADHQGSIIAHSNGSASILNRLAYDAYGIPGANNIDRFGYTGQLWMKEVGLFHYKARFYHPKLGRFLQTDPVGYEDQMNMYAYVHNDPINYTDPNGEFAMLIGAAVGALVDAGIQVSANMASGQGFGEAVSNINGASVVASAALGAVGQIGGASLATKAVSGLSNGAKGKLGEAVARVGIAARGEKVIATQTPAGKVSALGNVSGRGANAKPDFVVRDKSGNVKVVEAKFGSSQLTGAQKDLKNQMGDAFTVSRTTYDDVGNAGGAAGAMAGGAAGNCISGSSGPCQR